MRAPTGGPKDVTPPAPVEGGIVPANRSTNMQSKTVAITFDEYIKLNNPTQQVIISPPMETPPEFEIKKQTLFVTFTDDLLPNTTYTMNFGNAIQDITEGNSTEMQYVFSTGDHLDSLTFDGNVIQALTLKPVAGMKVMLYDPSSYPNPDSLPLLRKPFYFTTTNSSGAYHFENLKKGTYKLFALKDDNNNYIYDPGEVISFSDELITVSSDSFAGPTLKAFTEPQAIQFVEKDGYDAPGKYYVQFKNEPVNPTYSTSPEGVVKHLEKVGDSLVFWIDTSLVGDSLTLNLEVSGLDSLSFTHYFRSTERIPRKIRPVLNRKNLTPADTIKLEFEYPLLSVDGSSIFLLDKDSAVHRTKVLSEPWKRELQIIPMADSLEGRSILILDRKTVTSTYGGFNDSLSVPLVFLGPDEYGFLKLKLVGLNKLSGKLVLHLLNGSEQVVSKVLNPSEQETFSYLPPGKYKARIVIDKNGNGRWDPGNYLQGEQPENVIYLNESVSIRGGWDIDVDWNITASPQ